MWIISQDRIFARALQIVLKQAGFAQPKLLSVLPETIHSSLIVDLDDFEAPSVKRAVTFSSDPAKPADLIRPFLMNDFIALCKNRFTLEISAVPMSPDHSGLLLTDGGVLLNGQPVTLTPGERSLLRLLLAHSGECVPKEEIDKLWKANSNMTEVYIRYLRKKLDEPSGIRLIRTVRGKGYILCLPNTAP